MLYLLEGKGVGASPQPNKRNEQGAAKGANDNSKKPKGNKSDDQKTSKKDASDEKSNKLFDYVPIHYQTRYVQRLLKQHLQQWVHHRLQIRVHRRSMT